MSLSDKEILQLADLCSAVVDQTIPETQMKRLGKWIADSIDARQFYIRAMALSASLCHYSGDMYGEQPDAAPPGSRTRELHIWRWASVLMTVAAAVLLIFALRPRTARHESPALPVQQPVAMQTHDADAFVAQVTGARQCQWAKGSLPLNPGDQLRQGEKIILEKGFAEITFDCGAQVVLEGPASLDINSAWNVKLNSGAIRASLPPEAMGFSISNPTVEVVDLGTEFTMFTDASGAATEVMVLKGEVEATLKSGADQQPVVLRANQVQRFAAGGVSSAKGDAARFTALAQLPPLDRMVAPTRYLHWSFDRLLDNAFQADSGGPVPPDSSLLIENSAPGALTAATVRGHGGGALRFDGRLYAAGSYDGISSNTPHTVSFWIKIPRDSNLESAYSMIAWRVRSRELGLHPIQIDWNRYPSQGVVGALRTDYGGGFAVGETSLRDNRWHHIAVVFVPTGDSPSPLDVKQYVDGQFEGEGKPSPSGSNVFAFSPESESGPDNSGKFWLGCRVGVDRLSNERFRGEMDELYLIDRALEPGEIVELMHNNALHLEK